MSRAGVRALAVVERLLPARRAPRARAATAGVLLRAGWTPGLTPARASAVEAGLRLAFPEKDEAEVRRLVRLHARSLLSFGLTRALLEGGTAERVAEFCRDMEVSGGEHLRAARDHPGPVLMFSAHYGMPALACLRIGLELAGHKRLNTFYAPPEENAGNEGYQEMMEKVIPGVVTLPGDARAVKAGLHALRRGEVLTMQPDVYDNRAGTAMLVPFLDRLTFAMGGTAFFSLRGKAMVLPVYCWDTGRGRFHMRVEAPIERPDTGSFDDDAYLLTARIFASIGAQVRAAPEHWAYWATLRGRLLGDVRVPSPAAPDAWREAFRGLSAPCRATVPGVEGVLAELEARFAQGADS